MSLYVLQYLSGEEEEEEDEVGGSQRRRRRRLRKARKKTSIYDVYEPSELERGFFTDRDKDIRVTDMPERFQVQYFSYCMCHPQIYRLCYSSDVHGMYYQLS